MFIRCLLVLLIVFLIVYVLRLLLIGRQGVVRDRSPSCTPEKMVQCKYCGVHLPEMEAIGYGGIFFCCIDHLQQGKKI